jgi:hypothetical protein
MSEEQNATREPVRRAMEAVAIAYPRSRGHCHQLFALLLEAEVLLKVMMA